MILLLLAASVSDYYFDMKTLEKPYSLAVFPSKLGWFAILWADDRIIALTFGHKSSKSARDALPRHLVAQAVTQRSKMSLVQRLQAYAQGAKGDNFLDVKIEKEHRSNFKHRVLDLCRKIPSGTTLSYGQLASQAGSSRAARAVGNFMAGNKIPILIPCHRVVLASGGLGSYSAPGGISMKKRLLALENEWKKRPICHKKMG
jgi:methylated-DNA-[protein]-cysteine S-methyltransferase